MSTLRLDRARVPELVLEVLRTLRRAGKQGFLAGGAVRDLARLALGQLAPPPPGTRWPPDFDIATDALPEEVMKLFPRTIPTGLQHGTVTVMARGRGAGGAQEEHKVELTTFRGEGPYLDGRRPSAVTFLGDLEGDLARRDFTLNAMAWDPLEDDLRDPFGGMIDLRRRLLRAVGEARARFAEDGLRPLRAIRFAATLRLALERKTERAIGETLGTFDQVARERVHDELDKLLLRGHPPGRGARLLARTGLLARIFPALAAAAESGPRAWREAVRALDSLCAPAASAGPRAGGEACMHVHADRPAASLEVRYAILFSPLGPGGAAAACDAIKMSPKPRDRIAKLLGESRLDYAPAWHDGDCRRAMSRIGRPLLPDFFALRRALAAGQGEPARDEAMIDRWTGLLAGKPPLTLADLAIDGRGLIEALQLAPGPFLGKLLQALLDAVLHDPSMNSREALIRLSSELARKPPTGNPQA